MALTNSSRLNGSVKRMIASGLLTEQQARDAHNKAQEAKQSFISYLIQHKLLDTANIASIASQEFDIPFLDIDSLDIEHITANLIDKNIVNKHQTLPLFQRGKVLFVAITDPSNLSALKDFQFVSSLTVHPILVDASKLAKMLSYVMESANQEIDDDFQSDDLDDLDIYSEPEQGGSSNSDEELVEEAVDDTPVVRFVNGILSSAIKNGASDIHFEPYEKTYRIRMRIDGILQELKSPPVALGSRIAARIKILSRLDIAERRLPQDGRMIMRLSKNKTIDFRVNTCPTLFGEKIVLRILDPTSAQLGIDALGYEADQKQIFLEAMHKPQGMILVTGPTGSGKTVSLYTALNILNTDDRNISTAEDPSEINLPGINQVNVRTNIGLGFAECLRAFLRQDPDIIMVGEIRDLETAEIAIKAAQTGHMVFSTLHTNDAPQTLSRLANMGVSPFNIASAVTLIVAQRLARQLCTQCKAIDIIPNEALLNEGFTQQQLNDGVTIYKPIGCEYCQQGYKGRTGIYQVMPVSLAMQHIIMDGGNSLELAKQAEKEGIADLRRAGLQKVAAGLTSLEEINRVIKE